MHCFGVYDDVRPYCTILFTMKVGFTWVANCHHVRERRAWLNLSRMLEKLLKFHGGRAPKGRPVNWRYLVYFVWHAAIGIVLTLEVRIREHLGVILRFRNFRGKGLINSNWRSWCADCKTVKRFSVPSKISESSWKNLFA